MYLLYLLCIYYYAIANSMYAARLYACMQAGSQFREEGKHLCKDEHWASLALPGPSPTATPPLLYSTRPLWPSLGTPAVLAALQRS
jgi:hypothetical protein